MTAPAAPPTMVNLFLRAEAVAGLAAGITIWLAQDGSFWWFLALVLLPDLSMLGYMAGASVGALTYNLAHNWATGTVILGAGWWADNRIVLLIGALLLAHVGMDRLLGYGLKLTSGFQDTHLGRIGHDRPPPDPSD